MLQRADIDTVRFRCYLSWVLRYITLGVTAVSSALAISERCPVSLRRTEFERDPSIEE